LFYTFRQPGTVHQPPKGFAWVLTRELNHGSPWNRWPISYSSTTRVNIVTTLLQGTERKDWDKVCIHMRVGEEAAAEKTGGPTTRVRDRLMTYGQLLFRHKKEGISGIYPMNMPGHWRVMIVSHVLRRVLLLDPFGDASGPYGFTTDGIDNVQNSYSGYNVSTCPERLQTDRWNCGVWVA
jgi:hypothetical protein